MNLEQIPILSIVTFLPLLGALIILLIPRKRTGDIKSIALFTSLLTFLASLAVVFSFRASLTAVQFKEQLNWFPSFGLQYFLGVDGINILFLLLTTLLGLIAILTAGAEIKERFKEFMILLLILETALIGVFLALDFLLFYIFWELTLIPAYLLVGIWGGKRRIYATVKFFIYTLAGSLLMLVAMLAIYFEAGRTFNLLHLSSRQFHLDPTFQSWVFLAIFAAFAVKIALVPLHTWAPDAYVEAPTSVTVLLAGVLVKMGGYGFLRLSLPILPDASRTFTPLIVVLAVVTIIYAAILALAQKDLKRLMAYSSISHMGFVTLGIFVFNIQGVEGAIIQMFSHGLVIGALFLIIGQVAQRTGQLKIDEFGGLSSRMPIFATFFGLFTLASLGLPGLSGFVGEFLVLVGTFQNNRWLGALAATGVILAAVYLLWMFQRVMFGPVKETLRGLSDLGPLEVITLTPLAMLVIWLGVYPGSFLDLMHVSVNRLVSP